uniref:Signal transducer and activator of transcription n=1 Tax=Meloidogyne hapla TaxID=6305 RepID=A0A1I8BRX8_MELHA
MQSSSTSSISPSNNEQQRMALSLVAKDCQLLWEENKDMQGRFVNDISELQNFQAVIERLEHEQRHDQLGRAKQTLLVKGKKVKRLNDGVHLIAVMQNNLISVRLMEWKNAQKLAQIGMGFDQREMQLDEIQSEFEVLAENNWTLRAYACWQIDLLRRPTLLADSSAPTHITNLSQILETLTKMLCMLVSQSFVVAVQPDPVLKTQHKFVAEVRLLIGDRLGIKQQLVNTNVTVKIIAEDEAKMLGTGQINEKDIKMVGSISNDLEKLILDERGHMSAKFNNSKLTRIAHRKPPAKGSLSTSQIAQTATDQNQVLRHKFTLFTGAHRPLSDSDLAYLGDKLGIVHSNPDNKPITFQRFAKQNLREDVNFSFWEWFFLIMQLIKQKLLKFWDDGWLVGFISKHEASERMLMCHNPTFLLRFSDTQTGAVSIGFVCEEDGAKGKKNTFLYYNVPFHLAPFTIKDLDQLSLASRIQSCPQLKEVPYLYPDIDKEQMLAHFDTEERCKIFESPAGYIGSEIVMVAKTMSNSKLGSAVGSDSPSPMSNQWSPSEFQQSVSMDVGDDIVAMLGQNHQLDSANVESLLGLPPQQQSRMSSEQPLQQLDLSFMDVFHQQQQQHINRNYLGGGNSMLSQPPNSH